MIWKKRFVDYLTETCVFFQEDHSYWSVWVTYIPIQYNRVLWPGVQASSFSGPTCHSHYHQISTGFHAVSHIQILIDWHAQRVVLLSVGCGKWRTLVKVNFKGKVSIPSWKTEKDQSHSAHKRVKVWNKSAFHSSDERMASSSGGKYLS